MRIALYARKSQESDERQIQSLDDQIGALTAVSVKEGLRIDETFVESKSARTPGARPEFERLMAMVEAGRVDAVLTWSVNRLARNPVDGGRIQYLLQQGKLRFIRTIEKTYLPEDTALLLAIETGSATDYVRNLSRDVRRGLESKARAGWLASRAPLGYVNNVLTHEIEFDPFRFPLLRKGWEMMLSGGYTVQDVRRELTTLGLTAPGRKAAGRAVAASTLYKAFSSPFYCGFFSFRGEELRGKHPPMVTEEEFDRVQARMDKPLRKRLRKHDFAFSGLLRCGACGCRIVAEKKVKRAKTTGRVREYTYYHCSGGKGCPKRGVSEDALHEAFMETFDRVAIPESFAEWAKAEVRARTDGEVDLLVAGDGEGQRRAERERARMSRLGDMLLDGDVTREEYEEKRDELKARLESIEAGRKNVRSREDRALAILDERLSTAAMAASYERYEKPARRAMVRSLGAEHYLTLETASIGVHPVIQKIAAFEPLRNGSETPKPGDKVLENSCWQGFIDVIRTAARLEADIEIGREATRADKQQEGRRPERRVPIKRNRPPAGVQSQAA